MPYWDELTYNAVKASISNIPSTFLYDACYQRTYRTRGGRGRNLNIPVSNSVAEPYTHYDGVNDLKRRAYGKRFGNDGALQPDRGHPWHMVRFARSDSPLNARVTYLPNGTVIPYENVTLGFTSTLTAVPVPSDQANALDAYAKQQFVRAAPTSDFFDIATFIGELREGFSLLAFLKKSSLRDLERLLYGVRPGSVLSTSLDVVGTPGKNYLGYQFAVLPLVSDLRKIGDTLARATTALTGFNTPIHRNRTKGVSVNPTQTTSLNERPLAVAGGYAGIPLLESQMQKDYGTSAVQGTVGGIRANVWSSTSEETRTWYEAEYVLVPKVGFDPPSYLDKLEFLMNTDFTARTLWELSPWSWLADWTLKVGDSIGANEIATSNRLVTNYAYAMSEQKKTSVFVAKNFRPDVNYAAVGFPAQYVSTRTTTVKRRIRANPFGFNPVSSSITRTEQWAILGALAASKGR